ncbi:MAG TPA: shikimate dehydrogenase [Sphingobacteriaceae bacterium]|nr:shikimate dehydrogenase [Sphingobacteriaceae bacterium]
MEQVKFGLIGYPLGHSFSKQYYDAKIFQQEVSGVSYELFPLPHMDQFPVLLQENPDLKGVNVTIPHKITVLDYVDQCSPEAQEIGAVNCIQIRRIAGQAPFLMGYNTDVYGFQMSLQPLLQTHHRQALVLGNGGAAKAVCFALDQLGIQWRVVSRKPLVENGQLAYGELDRELMAEHLLIVNTTPLGTFPEVNSLAPIPYEFLTARHLLYDLVYNPSETAFLKKGLEVGATIKNGYDMLVLQAERNWEIWMEGLAL